MVLEILTFHWQLNPGNHMIDYAAKKHLEPKPLFTTLGSYDKLMVRPYDYYNNKLMLSNYSSKNLLWILISAFSNLQVYNN